MERALGGVLGRLLFLLARRRRRIALTNLRLAFPGLSEAERLALARRNFVYFAQAFLDRSWLWHGDSEVVRQRLRITGAVDDLTRAGAVVMFAPHFYGMDAGGSAIMQQIDRPACTIYSTQNNRALDEWMQRGRQRFGDATLLSRTEGVKPIVRALREGKMLYLLPDMDLGPTESVFVPFYGVPTATVPSLSRFAKLGHARVVPVVTIDVGIERPCVDDQRDGRASLARISSIRSEMSLLPLAPAPAASNRRAPRWTPSRFSMASRVSADTVVPRRCASWRSRASSSSVSFTVVLCMYASIRLSLIHI